MGASGGPVGGGWRGLAQNVARLAGIGGAWNGELRREKDELRRPRPVHGPHDAYYKNGKVGLSSECDQVKLGVALDGLVFPDRPGEYNGIVVDGDLVWTTFTGTSQEELDGDANSNPSVIWSCRVPFD